jgi:hypothetical protein
MALYQILRNVGQISDDEIDAAGYRAIACMPAFSGLNWLRSYFDANNGQLICFYEAANSDDIRRHAEMAHLPCDTVIEVLEYLPQRYR